MPDTFRALAASLVTVATCIYLIQESSSQFLDPFHGFQWYGIGKGGDRGGIATILGPYPGLLPNTPEATRQPVKGIYKTLHTLNEVIRSSNGL